jgi:transcriptional regulator with XRE-family HTH domain
MLLNNIYEIRQELGISLRKLEKLSGVDYSSINLIENGIVYPTQINMLKISRGLNKETHEVFDLTWRGKNL